MNLTPFIGKDIGVFLETNILLAGTLKEIVGSAEDEVVLVPFNKEDPNFKTIVCVPYPTHFNITNIKFFRELDGKAAEQDLFTRSTPSNRI